MSILTPPTNEDWRRQGQEKYLMGVKLILRNYDSYNKEWDHDHCEFCGKKFSLGTEDLNIGYSTLEGHHWICPDCFNDFKSEFKWSLE